MKVGRIGMVGVLGSVGLVGRVGMFGKSPTKPTEPNIPTTPKTPTTPIIIITNKINTMDYSKKKIGSYKTLLAYQKAECVYDITFYFVNRFLDRAHDRTVDQMQQAARSGKQNIVEGYSDAEGSSQTEHKLMTVAKGSLEELKEDYQDYLRTHQLELWSQGHYKYKTCQPLFRKHNDSDYYMRQIEGRTDEDIANIALIVIHQTLALLRGYIDRQDRLFIQEGGIKEQRFKMRKEYRDGKENRESRFSRESRDCRETPTEPTTPTKPTTPIKNKKSWQI